MHRRTVNRIQPMTPISATKAPSPASTTTPIDKQDFDDVRRMLQGQFVRGNPAVPRGRSYPVGAHANGLPQGRFGPSSFPAARGFAMGHKPRPPLHGGPLAASGRRHPANPTPKIRFQAAGNGFLRDIRAGGFNILRFPLASVARLAFKFVSRLINPSKA